MLKNLSLFAAITFSLIQIANAQDDVSTEGPPPLVTSKKRNSAVVIHSPQTTSFPSQPSDLDPETASIIKEIAEYTSSDEKAGNWVDAFLAQHPSSGDIRAFWNYLQNKPEGETLEDFTKNYVLKFLEPEEQQTLQRTVSMFNLRRVHSKLSSQKSSFRRVGSSASNTSAAASELQEDDLLLTQDN